jgi:putative heme-binding domain-containing protein
VAAFFQEFTMPTRASRVCAQAALSLLATSVVVGSAAAQTPAAKTPAAKTPAAKTPAAKTPAGKTLPYSPEAVKQLLQEARTRGDARRGASVFMAHQFACVSCHKVGKLGGTVGPELSEVGKCLPPDKLVEAVLWPKREVKEGFVALQVITADGKTHQGYKEKEDGKQLVLRDPGTGKSITIKKSNIEDRRETGTLMPEGLAEAMTFEQRRDLVRFLLDLGTSSAGHDLVTAHSVEVAKMPIVREPLNPQDWPSWQQPVNRNRLYDFYAREAIFFRKQLPNVPMLLPAFPGLDGGTRGHWGNQNETSWKDARWNLTDLGSLQCGVFRGAGVTVPRGVCVRLGDKGELSACFNPDTLSYEMVWTGGFVKFSDVRHGFMDGLIMDGTPVPLTPQERGNAFSPLSSKQYRGFYRHGKRVLFAYILDGVDYLDAPWVENGKFTRIVVPTKEHPLARLTKGGESQWPQVLTTRGKLGSGAPYAVDTIAPPFENPWKALLFFGDHDFLPDGTALICTMEGDVWRVDGLDDKLDNVRWRRIAAGLHQALGHLCAGPQPDQPAARLERGRRDRFLRVLFERLHHLPGRTRFHLRPPARPGGQLLHRLRQSGPVENLCRRQTCGCPGHRLSQS